MNELGNFFISFTTTGLTELKDGLKDINTKLDGLNDSFQKSTNGGDKFFAGFKGWAGQIAGLAAGVLSLGKAIKDTFSLGDKIINLNLLADAAGATAEEVEALAIATQPMGGTVQSAANFYRTMNNLQTEMGRGQYGEAMREELSRAGFFVSPMASAEEYMRALSSALTNYTNLGKFGDRDKLAKAFGLDDSMMLFLSSGYENVDKMLAYGRQHSVMSGKDNLQAAMEMRKALNELKEVWNRLLVDMMPVLTGILNLLKPILEALAPIAQWALKQIGGILDTINTVADVISGNTTIDEAAQHFMKQDNIIGSAARFAGGLGEQYSEIATANRRSREMRQLAEKFNAGEASWGEMLRLKTLMTELDAFNEGEREILDTAIANLRPTYNPLNARSSTSNVSSNASVNVDTINITGMGESAGRQTADAVQRHLNRLDFQPATLGGGVK